MRERPILLNAEMVRAVLDGRKTQTRRIVKWRGLDEGLNLQFSGLRAIEEPGGWVIESNSRTSSEWRCQPTPSPFGAVGDRLWVRETFSGHYIDDDQIQDIKDGRDKASDLCEYRADYPNGSQAFEGWTPSIHMPRWASRITLEITGVRVERLQDISRADAIAEGGPPSHPSIDAASRDHGFPDFSRSWFGQTWWNIYGEESWQANPWVWVIEFKRVEGEA